MPQASAWNKFPTKEDPSKKYKFTSLEINLSPDKLVVNRETYSMLDWLGDLGGLFDALRLLCTLGIFPVSSFSLQATLMSKLFRQRPSTDPSLNNLTPNLDFKEEVKSEKLSPRKVHTSEKQ